MKEREEKQKSRFQPSLLPKCPPEIALMCPAWIAPGWGHSEKGNRLCQFQRVTEIETGCEPLMSSSRGIVDPPRRFLASELAKVKHRKKNCPELWISDVSICWPFALPVRRLWLTPTKDGIVKWSDISKTVPSPCDPDWSSADTKVGDPPSRDGRNAEKINQLQKICKWLSRRTWRHIWRICQQRH